MPRGKSNQSKKGKYAAQKFEFCNLEFSDRERALVLEWIGERDRCLEDCIGDIADRDFKLSLSLNSWTGMYVCAVTCKNDDNPMYNVCVTYEHVDLGKLAQIMLWALAERFDFGNTYQGQQRSVNDW